MCNIQLGGVGEFVSGLLPQHRKVNSEQRYVIYRFLEAISLTEVHILNVKAYFMCKSPGYDTKITILQTNCVLTNTVRVVLRPNDL